MERRKPVFIASVLSLVGIAITVVAFFAPEGGSRDIVRRFGDERANVGVRLTLDTLDATRGVLRVRVNISSQNLPEEGATLFTDLPGLTAVSLPVDSVSADKVSEVLVDAGDIADYPYDSYSHAFQFLAVPGRNAALPTTVPERVLPLALELVNALPGFSGEARVDDHDGITTMTTELPRQTASVVWASGMIGIYWLLAICAFAVMLATVLGLRTFETRHLAWLVAMIFAFSAFRGTAPGSPPIGVFLDFASFFWAEAIVALSLIALVTYYLTGDRGAPDELVVDQASGRDATAPSPATVGPDSSIAAAPASVPTDLGSTSAPTDTAG